MLRQKLDGGRELSGQRAFLQEQTKYESSGYLVKSAPILYVVARM